jgi:hypothetical protein
MAKKYGKLEISFEQEGRFENTPELDRVLDRPIGHLSIERTANDRQRLRAQSLGKFVACPPSHGLPGLSPLERMTW